MRPLSGAIGGIDLEVDVTVARALPTLMPRTAPELTPTDAVQPPGRAGAVARAPEAPGRGVSGGEAALRVFAPRPHVRVHIRRHNSATILADAAV